MGVGAPVGQLAFESGVAFCNERPSAGAERLVLKAVEGGLERGEFGRRNYHRTATGLAILEMVKLAVIADAVEMAEKTEGPNFVGGSGAQDTAPNLSGIGTANRLAILVGFGQLQADSANIRTQVERLDIEEVHLDFLVRRMREALLKVRRLLANFQPVEEGVGSFEPDSKPVRDFFFFGALVGVNFVVARDHFGAATAEAGNFADAFGGLLVSFENKFT